MQNFVAILECVQKAENSYRHTQKNRKSQWQPGTFQGQGRAESKRAFTSYQDAKKSLTAAPALASVSKSRHYMTPFRQVHRTRHQLICKGQLCWDFDKLHLGADMKKHQKEKSNQNVFVRKAGNTDSSFSASLSSSSGEDWMEKVLLPLHTLHITLSA